MSFKQSLHSNDISLIQHVFFFFQDKGYVWSNTYYAALLLHNSFIITVVVSYSLDLSNRKGNQLLVVIHREAARCQIPKAWRWGLYKQTVYSRTIQWTSIQHSTVTTPRYPAPATYILCDIPEGISLFISST